MTEMTTIDCFECGKEFDTSEVKMAGDLLSCPHCKQKMEADIDADENDYFWFAIPEKSKR